MRIPRTRVLLTALFVLAIGGGLLWADEQQARGLLEQARAMERAGRANQAYRLYHEVLRQHPKSAAVVEARYGAARYMAARRNWWQSGWLMQQGLADKQHTLSAEWERRYKLLAARSWVSGTQANLQTVPYLQHVLRGLEGDKAAQEQVDEVRFLLARAHAGPHAYRTKNQRKEDATRLDAAVAAYRRIIADNQQRGDRAARARFELGALWALHLRNLKGDGGFFPAPRTYQFSKQGEDYDARFRGGVASALAIFKQIEELHASSSWAAQAAYARAWVHDRLLHELPRAVALYRECATSHPGAPHAGNARARIEQITREELGLGSLRIVRPGKRPALPAIVRNIARVDVRIWALELDRVLEARRDIDILRAAQRHVERQGSAPDQRFVWNTGCKEDHLGVRGTLELPVDQAGAYLVEGRGRDRVVRVLVVLSDLALATTTFNGQALAMTSDLTTGRPAAGVEVAYLRRGRVVRERTGADGMAVLRHEHQPRYSDSVLAVARRGAHHALSQGYAGWYHRDPGRHRLYVTTDRPLYRPGHTVRFKVIARRHSAGRYENVDGAELVVRVMSPRGDKVYDRRLVADAEGACSGEFALKDKAMLGMYRFHVLLDGAQSAWYGQHQGGTFRVEEYKKPEFLVEVTPGAGDYIPGDKIEMTAKAQLYDGQPVRLAAVRWQVYWQAYRRPQQPPLRVNPAVGSGGGSWRGRGRWGGWNPMQQIAQGSGVTDEKGALVIGFGSHAAGKGHPSGDGTFTVNVQVVDKSRRMVAGSGSIAVIKQGLLATITTERNIGRPGEAMPVTVRVATPGGRPSAAKGWVVVRRAQGKALEQVASFKLAVGADGVGRCQVTPDRDGFYAIEFNTSDRRDNPVAVTAWLLAAGEGYRGAGAERLAAPYRLLPDRTSYDVGQTARLLLARPGYSGTAFVFYSADGELLGRRTVELQAGGGLFSLPIGESHAPNLYVTAVVLAPDGIAVERQELRVSPAHRRLSIALDPDQPHYRPGEKARVGVRVSGPDGKPLQTACWLAVFDTSLLAIQPETAREILDQFYGHRRAYQARLFHSYAWIGPNRGEWLPGRAPARRRTTADPRALGWAYWQWFAGWQQGSFFQTAGKSGAPRPAKQGGPGAPKSLGLRGGIAKDSGRADEAEAPQAKAPGSPAESRSRREAKKEGQAAPVFKKAVVRRNFQDTACWAARVETGADGRGSVAFKFPDNLTTWKIVARAATPQTLVGQAERTVRTRKLLRIRLAAPRFFTERDEVVLSGVVSNNLRSKKEIKLVLALRGGTLALKKDGKRRHERIITLEPGKDYRADWRVTVTGSGRATIELQALSDEESDAVERSFPVIRHGITKHSGTGGAVVGRGGVAGDRLVLLPLQVPAERDIDSTELRVVLAPSVAVTALEALPYLAAYPYGCVEQTMSRFGPSVLVKHSLARLGLPIEALVGDKQGSSVPAGLWGKPHYRKMTVLRGADLQRIVDAGLARLYAFQHADGGWGWWRYDRTNDYMTAYVVDGLLAARDSDLPVEQHVIRRGLDYLVRRLLPVDLSRLEKEAKQRYPEWERNRLSYLTYVVLRGMSKKAVAQRGEIVALARHLALHADGMTPYSRALVALACHHAGAAEQARALVAGLSRDAQVDPKSGDASWGRGGGWWRWYRDPVETQAFALRALLAIEPKSKLIPGLVGALVHARRGTRWHSTKTTAIAVAALIEYLAVSGELEPDFTATVKYDGQVIGQVRFTRDNLLDAENVIRISGSQIKSGGGQIEIVKQGKGNLYYAAFLRYFTLEEDIQPAGYRIAVTRSFTRITRRGTAEQREPLKSGSRIVSGDIVEVRLALESDRDYEYLALEDRKAAGLEALRQTSGRGPGIATHMELRDDRVVIFASRVPKGKSEIVYRFRAEAPGEFHALPLTAYLMYAPDIRANSAEWRIKITDE